MNAPVQATYSPAIFNVRDINEAKRIILTKEDRSTDERWKIETPYLVGLIEQCGELNANSVVLDYGCGVGRLSKALIEKYGCFVVGVDISASMRALAAVYVDSDKFFACSPDALQHLNLKCDLALAVWVLQHTFDPSLEIKRIKYSLKPSGQLFVVNDHRRIVPTTTRQWINDGQDIKALLNKEFQPGILRELSAAHVGEAVAAISFWASYKV